MIIVLGLVIYTMIQFSLVFENKLDAEVWEDSCKSGLYNCCCCVTDDTEDKLYPPPACPEWTTGIVSGLCQAFLTLVALSTTLCLAFVVCSIFVATLLYRNLKAYEVRKRVNVNFLAVDGKRNKDLLKLTNNSFFCYSNRLSMFK